MMRRIPNRAIERLRRLEVTDEPERRLDERQDLADIEPHRATRLVPCIDGWLAVTLSRPSDLELMPAWLESDIQAVEGVWGPIESLVREREGRDLIDRAILLGLPASLVGETTDPQPCRRRRMGDASSMPLDAVTVVDLSSLWAGPLCGALLAGHGARVVKVESIERPDGARATPKFFAHLNSMKEHRLVPVAALPEAIADADVVIEASRPRALANLGVDAYEQLRSGRPRVWVSISAHGRDSDRVGFGDDTAAAGGLVEWEGGRPHLLGDAVADPASGLVAASAVIEALASGGHWMLDIAMARVAAWLAFP